MRTDTIEEPTVVRNDDRTTGEVLQSFFECSECVHINIVGRFVDQRLSDLQREPESQGQDHRLYRAAGPPDRLERHRREFQREQRLRLLQHAPDAELRQHLVRIVPDRPFLRTGINLNLLIKT